MDVRERTTHRIETFGGLMVTGATAPPTGAATQRKTLLLLAVLAAAGSQGVGRERLLGLFWPDSDTERARHALKQAIHALRRDLRDAESIVGVPTLRLNPDSITSDVADFEEAIARGELERAVALYRGPFLDGMWLDGAPEFERWLERERARFAHLHATALERLAAGAAGAGDRAAAAAWWRRLAAVDPLSSRVAVELMKALAAAGEPEAALQHARVHEQLVRQELDTPPDAAVTALAARVREGLRTGRPPAPAAATAGSSTAATAAATDTAAPAPDAAPAAQAAPAAPAAPATPAISPPGALPASPPVASPPPRRSRRRSIVAVASLAVLAVAVGAVALLATRRDDRVDAANAASAARSVAVLPFVDMSEPAGNAYFGDGLSEELITVLSRVDGLKVAARTSSFALRDARLDVRAIGDTLGVATVVEGSVRRDGDRVRVTAQLIDARSGYHIWSGAYDRELDDLLALQDELAAAIASELGVRLGTARMPARSTSSEAYDLYLRGIWFRNRMTKPAIDQALVYYDQAIALDSMNALAYAGKASAMGPLFYYRHAPSEPGISQMRAAARRAIELDDQLGEAHVAMGLIHFFYDWDWDAAGREFRRAIELNPGDSHAWHMVANYRRATGKLEEAIVARRRSLELDPLNARTAISLGRDYMAAGQLDQAAVAYRRGADIDSMNPLLLGLGPNLPVGMGEVYERQGRHADAVGEFVRVAARRGATAAEQGELRQAFATGGMRGFWRRWLAFEQRTSRGAPRAFVVARIHERLGDTTRAIAGLERAFAEHDPGLVYLGVDPEWTALRSDPRVAAIVEHVGQQRAAR